MSVFYNSIPFALRSPTDLMHYRSRREQMLVDHASGKRKARVLDKAPKAPTKAKVNKQAKLLARLPEAVRVMLSQLPADKQASMLKTMLG